MMVVMFVILYDMVKPYLAFRMNFSVLNVITVV